MTTVFWGLMIPFAGTTFGAACVFFMKREMHDGVRRALMGFAAGVMIAASSKNSSPKRRGMIKPMSVRSALPSVSR